ncbi:hypothetical protein V6Z12_D09G185700 [Gossypium hirsutum]
MFIYRPSVFENVVATEAPINLLSRWNTADLIQQLGKKSFTLTTNWREQ